MNKQLIGIKNEKWVVTLLCIFFSVGILGFALPFTQPWMLLLTPIVLYSGILLIFILTKPQGQGFYWVMGIGALITFLLEVLGVHTGLVFGDYVYSTVLGLSLFGVPLVIGINWVMIIWGLEEWVFSKIPALWSIFLTAIGGVLFDVLLEPVAIKYNFWAWDGVDVPLQNYIAWFSIGLALALAFRLVKVHQGKSLPFAYVLVQGGFFLGINILILTGLSS